MASFVPAMAALALACLPVRLAALSITEIHYAPPAGDEDLQFVEVFNDASSVVDLSGWRFSRGIDFVFPEGTVLAGRAYLVVCAHAAAVASRFGIANTAGDFSGSLSSDGETLEILNESGVREVQVSYRDRGKWPSAPKGTGHTLALKSPYLDPDDGVSWTASSERGGTPGRQNFPPVTPGFEETAPIAKGAVWRYRKGLAPFSTPPGAWRAAGFDDTAWLSGPTGIGYGDNDDATTLDDMQNGYFAIACRRTFTLTAKEVEAAEQVILAIDYDDGLIAYLNGVEVARAGLGSPGEATPFDGTADNHEAGVEEEFAVPKGLLAAGSNVLAVEVHNTTLDSSDLSFIPRLILRRTIPSTSTGGTPVVFNELFARTTGERWLELFNRGDLPVDLTGYGLTDDPSQLTKHALPAGSSIGARGFLVVTEPPGLDFASPLPERAERRPRRGGAHLRERERGRSLRRQRRAPARWRWPLGLLHRADPRRSERDRRGARRGDQRDHVSPGRDA
jgi:hypothetical protein